MAILKMCQVVYLSRESVDNQFTNQCSTLFHHEMSLYPDVTRCKSVGFGGLTKFPILILNLFFT